MHRHPSEPPSASPPEVAPSDARARRSLRRGADLAGDVLLIAALVAVVVALAWQLRLISVPVLIGAIAASVLLPAVDALSRRGLQRTLATIVVVLGCTTVLVGAGVAIVPPLIDRSEELLDALGSAAADVRAWARQGPLRLSDRQVEEIESSVSSSLDGQGARVAAGALSGAITVVQVVAGALVSAIVAFFLLKDGHDIVRWAAQRAGERAGQVHAAAGRVRRVLAAYFGGVTIDGLVEGTLIGIGLAVLGVPLAVPLAVITFFGGYVPIVGALVAGTLAAAVALVSQGPATALAVILIAVVVQNVVTNVIDPLVMSRAVKLHPLVVLISVTSFGLVAGIVGVFIAVPVVAAVVELASVLRAPPDRTG